MFQWQKHVNSQINNNDEQCLWQIGQHTFKLSIYVVGTGVEVIPPGSALAAAEA